MKKEIDVMLEVLLGKELAELWWHRPNKHFNDKTPLEVFEKTPERVYNYVLSV